MKRSRPTSLVRKDFDFRRLVRRESEKIEFRSLRGELAVMAKVDTILDEIKGLTLLEASDLVKKMEEAFGVSAAAATVVAAGGGGAGAGAPGGGKAGFTRGLPDGGGHKMKGR